MENWEGNTRRVCLRSEAETRGQAFAHRVMDRTVVAYGEEGDRLLEIIVTHMVKVSCVYDERIGGYG